MEHETHSDSLSQVTVKEYPSSEINYAASEPPPAYHRMQQATTVQVAKIIAYTIVVVSIVLGCFILASAYVQANAQRGYVVQEPTVVIPQALVQEEQIAEQSSNSIQTVSTTTTEQAVKEKEMTADEAKTDEKTSEDHKQNTIDETSEYDSDYDESDDDDGGRFPLQFDIDNLVNALVKKNQRSKLNCVVEKKRADQVVDHQPRAMRLPFGLDIITDPRFEHVTGEKMVIVCESGNEREIKPQSEEIHVQPILIPLPEQRPNPHFIPQQRPQQMQQPYPRNQLPMIPPHVIAQHIAHEQRVALEAIRAQQQMQRIHEIEQMHRMQPPPPPSAQPPHHMQPQMQPHHMQPHHMQPQMQPHHMEQHHMQPQMQPHHMQQQMQPHPMQQHQMPQMALHMQPPMEHPILRPVQRMQPEVNHVQPIQQQMVPPKMQIEQQQLHPVVVDQVPESQKLIHVPESVLTEINRLPHEQIIAVHVTEELDKDEDDNEENAPQEQQQVRIIQEPRQNAQEMNGRQILARDVPINIALSLMQKIRDAVIEDSEN